MSKRKRRLKALRDRLAQALARRVAASFQGTYDIGLEILSTALGVRVAARVGDFKVQRTLWPMTVKKGLDALARELVEAARRSQGTI